MPPRTRLEELDPRRGRTGRPWQRLRQWAKDNLPWVCCICGGPISPAYTWPSNQSWSLDHRIPLEHGGHPTDPANLGAAHLGCNSGKGDRLTVSDNLSDNW